jgi:hypothetical protein
VYQSFCGESQRITIIETAINHFKKLFLIIVYFFSDIMQLIASVMKSVSIFEQKNYRTNLCHNVDKKQKKNQKKKVLLLLLGRA